jgi:hypothetical protein
MKSERPASSKQFSADTTVSLDLTEFQPKPHYLLTLLDRLYTAGISTILLRWGEMFPWTVDSRFCSATAYPEEIFAGFLREAEKKNIKIVPWAPLLGDSQFFVSYPCYAYMKGEYDSVTLFSVLEKRCIPLFEDMVQDIVSLLPSLSHVAVPVSGDNLKNPQAAQEAAKRITILLEQFSCDPLFVYFRGPHDHHDGGEIEAVAENGSLLQLHSFETGKKFTIFEDIHRAEIDKVTETVDRGWRSVQRLREYLVRMGIDCIDRYKYARIIREEETALTRTINELEAVRQGFFTALLSSFEEISVRRWFFSKTMPLKEEYALVSARIAQLHPEPTENNNL